MSRTFTFQMSVYCKFLTLAKTSIIYFAAVVNYCQGKLILQWNVWLVWFICLLVESHRFYLWFSRVASMWIRLNRSWQRNWTTSNRLQPNGLRLLIITDAKLKGCIWSDCIEGFQLERFAHFSFVDIVPLVHLQRNVKENGLCALDKHCAIERINCSCYEYAASTCWHPIAKHWTFSRASFWTCAVELRSSIELCFDCFILNTNQKVKFEWSLSKSDLTWVSVCEPSLRKWLFTFCAVLTGAFCMSILPYD